MPINSVFERYTINPANSLVTNPLSGFWKQDSCFKKVICGPIAYALGSIGYAASIPYRIAQIGKESLQLFVSLFRGIQPLKTHLFVWIVSFAELGNAIFGIFCPPLAYKVDEYFQSFKVVQDNNFYPGYTWGNQQDLNLNNGANESSGTGESNTPLFQGNLANYNAEIQSMDKAHKVLNTLFPNDYELKEYNLCIETVLPAASLFFWIRDNSTRLPELLSCNDKHFAQVQQNVDIVKKTWQSLNIGGISPSANFTEQEALDYIFAKLANEISPHDYKLTNFKTNIDQTTRDELDKIVTSLNYLKGVVLNTDEKRTFIQTHLIPKVLGQYKN